MRLLELVVAYLAVANSLPSEQDLCEELGPQLLTKSSDLYNASKEIYNTHPSNDPDLVFVPETLMDVVNVVRTAYTKSIPVAIKSGGRDFLGMSTCSGECIQISLANMTDISVDRGSMTANVSAGINNGEAYAALFPENLALASGTCEGVGYSGLTLGGGLGVLMRKYGLAADNVVAIQIVLYNGTVLVVKPHSHQDLFWALRGGGAGSYGVVVSYQIRVFDASETKMQIRTYQNVASAFNTSRQAPFFAAWQEWIDDLPAEAYSQFAYNSNGNVVMVLAWNGTASSADQAVVQLKSKCTTCDIKRIETWVPAGFTCKDSYGNSSDLSWEEAVNCLWGCGE
jgi:FAD/FMN-containing dehydrogenase